MKRSHWIVPLASGLVTVGAARLITGCSSSQTSTPSGEVDATTDVLVNDSAPDSPVTDSGSDADSSSPADAADAADASDSAVTAFDAAAMYAFPGQVSYAICDRTAACCGLTIDSGAFNLSYCLGIAANGFYDSNEGVAFLDGGHVAFSPTQAAACIQNIESIDCAQNDIPQQLEIAIFQSCYGALYGTLDAGSTCRDPIECAPGNYCNIDAGMDAGTCAALVESGQPCGNSALNVNVAQTLCSYRGSGNTGLFCNWTNPTETAVLDAAAWTCEPPSPLDAGCASNQGCTSLICYQAECSAAKPWETDAGCVAYIVPAEAGAGH
ncbi:MAG TPA: hypothetical protein VEK07_11080 [Polyangiaceae bacterium]|nr:hypothetical protein [Polyangiaceae bacterium]